MLRKLSGNTCGDSEFSIKDGLPGVDIQVLKVEGGSSFDGKTLADLDFRKMHGVTVLSVRRGSDLIYTPEGNFILQAKDACILLGKPDDLCSIRRFFESANG
jgi:monovalent cation:H+ antiporter-2, CPA2 family